MLKAIPRKPKFDPGATFEVCRPLTCAGVAFALGQKFDKSLTDTRRLRQIYEANYLKQLPTERVKLARGAERVRMRKTA